MSKQGISIEMNRCSAFKLIIFIGPQGAGKTTQAKLLARHMQRICNTKVKTIKLIHYSILHKLYFSILKIFKRMRVKFYEGHPYTEVPSRKLFAALFPLYLLLHLLGFAISSMLFTLFKKISRGYVIEDEGYIFKQLADLLYTALFYKIDLSKNSMLKFILDILIRKVRLMFNYTTVVYLRTTNHKILRKRYITQKRGLIEPLHYVLSQIATYDVLINTVATAERVLILNSSERPTRIYQLILRMLNAT